MQHRRRESIRPGLSGLLLMWLALPVAGANSIAMNYLLNCQGCHEVDGSGQPGYVPDFRSSIARFVGVAEGRAYLGRVPGISQSFLSDPDRAAVLNWILVTFDPEHVPENFQPYTAGEMAGYRRDPLSQASTERVRVLARMSDALTVAQGTPGHGQPGASSALAASPAATSTPPPQFALCGACHPTSSDGASAIGPNLRNVVGRRAGTLDGFPYSKAMRSSGIVWTSEALDAFLANVQEKVPGTVMTLQGISDSGDRAAVIAYLQSLH